MRGHIRRRGDSWELFYDLGADPLTGRRRLRTRTVHGTRQDAEKALTVLLGRVAEGTEPDPGRITVAEFAERWLTLVEGTVRPTTFDYYRQKLALACKTIGRRELRSLTGERLTGMYRTMGGAPQTVVHVHRVLHRMLRDAQQWGLLPSNPAASALPPRVERPRPLTWTGGQVARFLQHVRQDRLGALWRLACTTGMRRGELCGLKWPHVDLTGAALAVEESRVMVAGRPEQGRPKTRTGRRRVSLDAETVRILSEHRQTQDGEREWFGEGYQDGGWVFCWEDGRAYSPDWVSRRFIALAADAGLPRIRFHDLRHTYATLALEAGVHPKVVADRLGHAGVQITLDTYTGHSDEMDRRAAAQVSALFC